MNTMILIALSEVILLLLLVIVILIEHLTYEYRNNYYQQLAEDKQKNIDYLVAKLKKYEGKKKC